MNDIDKMSLSSLKGEDFLTPIENHVKDLLNEGREFHKQKTKEAYEYIFYQMLEPEEFAELWSRFNSLERSMMKETK